MYKLLESIKKFLENTPTDISPKDKNLINEGNVETIEKVLQRVSDSPNEEKASKASFKLAKLNENQANYLKAIKYYTKAVDFPNFNELYRKEGIKLAKKLKLKKEEKYFNNKLYYGSLNISKGGIYTGVIKNGVPSYCGIVQYHDGSHYIGQFNQGHRIGYGFAHIKGNKERYSLRRYNNKGELISRGEKVQTKEKNNKILIGEMKKGTLHGRGLVLYENKNILLTNFKNGNPKNGESCYFEPNQKVITWR